MFKYKAILFMVCLAILCAPSVFAEEAKHKMHHHGKEMMKKKEHNLEARLAKLSSKLKLTPEQKVKVKEILTRAHNEAKAIFEEAKAKVKEIRLREHEEIKALLNEEQKNKFQHKQRKHKNCPDMEGCVGQDKE